jgi:uncharacterized membrane protein (UPF0182 family)
MRQPPTRPRVQRRWLIIGGVAVLLFISGSTVVRFYTDLLWFDELGFASVFWKIISTRAAVGTVGGLVAGIVVLVNLEIARRSAPRYRFVTAGTDVAEQYRSAFRPYARIASIGISALVAVFTGLSTSAVWERFLLWRNAVPFGVRAPQPFGHDVSYYVFTIPFQRALLSWLFGIAVVSLLLAVLAHLLNGSISPEANRIQVSTAVKVHVSALLAALALLKGWAYYLDRFDLVYSTRGPVTGALYTDVKVQRRALELLAVIAILAAIALIVNVVRFRGWLLPGAALAIWIFTSILAGAVIPALVQRFQVKPNEARREAPYIKANIAATREAFGLDGIVVRPFTPQDDLSKKDVANNRGTVDNVRVWDPEVLHPTYQRRQAIRTYYEFDDVDVDRYTLDGELRQVMLSGREVDPTKLEARAQNWVNTKLQYTHGYGLVANRSNSVTSEGLPELLVRDLPPKGIPDLLPDEPRIYFGQRMGGGDYAVVKTKQREIDYPRGEETVRSSYEGKGGIPMSNIMRRLAFALRFSDTDLAVSSLISPESRVLMRRNIIDRVSAAAPFLQFDRDPYLVVADERLVWVIDAYTTTDRFPYSERVSLDEAVPGGRLHGNTNYIRNSVKVAVDAYDGTTTFYLVEGTSDALARTYQRAFPDLFVDGKRMPAALKEHQRYPEDLFNVQASQYRRYHITNAEEFYSQEDAWDIPIDPPRSQGSVRVPMEPYYVVMKLPWEAEEEFLLMLPFQPRGRPTLNGWMAARMDPGHYGELVELRFPRGASADSPQNISARINQEENISDQFTLWSRAGSKVGHGPIFVIPIERTLMYVQPIYLTAEQQDVALPELRRVIVVIGDEIGFERTLEGSLEAALEGRVPTVEEEEPPAAEEPGQPEEPAAPTGNVAELLEEAVGHFERAEAALRDGDLATYQRENEAGRRAVEQARSQAD